MRPAAGFLIALGLLGVVLVGVRMGGRRAEIRVPQDRKAPMLLTIPRMDGGDWAIAGEQGKVVLVNFWATWCPPCREETPWLVRLSQEYEDRGLTVVGVSMDEERNAGAVRQFVARYRIPYPILWPGDNSPFEQYLSGLPTTMLADRKGRLVKTYIGMLEEDEVRRDVQALLAEEP